MSVSTDTVTAEVVLTPIADALSVSHGWPPSARVCLLFREDNILVVFTGLGFGEPHVEVLEMERPELYEVVKEVTIPKEIYQAARGISVGLNKLKKAVPFLEAAQKRKTELFWKEQRRLLASMPKATISEE